MVFYLQNHTKSRCTFAPHIMVLPINDSGHIFIVIKAIDIQIDPLLEYSAFPGSISSIRQPAKIIWIPLIIFQD